jgi:predicted RNase H-like HicB family nuclease
MRALVVVATWDDEAGMWVAESDDIPGLVTEAPTREELEAKVRVMIPELREANRTSPPLAEVVMHWHQETRIIA